MREEWSPIEVQLEGLNKKASRPEASTAMSQRQKWQMGFVSVSYDAENNDRSR
jgi:hypothetical protein